MTPRSKIEDAPATALPWARRCPRGHAGLKTWPAGERYKCVACDTIYTGPPIDARDVESFPLEGAEIRRLECPTQTDSSSESSHSHE